MTRLIFNYILIDALTFTYANAFDLLLAIIKPNALFYFP